MRVVLFTKLEVLFVPALIDHRYSALRRRPRFVFFLWIINQAAMCAESMPAE